MAVPLRGTASRRRPSMDWPLSREEKKCCAMQLYEKDVQTCNEMLEDKDRALQEAQEEIKVLRRASLASTRTSRGGHSCSGDSQGEIDADGDDDRPMQEASSPCKSPAACDGARRKSDVIPQRSKCDRLASPRLHSSSMQRSSSLEAVSSWWAPAWKAAEPDVARGMGGDSSQNSSPRRPSAMRRSSSLEAASSWWAPAWKAVQKGAQRATDTAKDTARILADETRLLVDEARLLVEPKSHDAVPGTDATLTSNPPPTEYFEWHVDIDADSGSSGLILEPHVEGQPWRVSGVIQGLGVAAWNAESMPVTVYLHPGRREAVMRRIAVRPGDELTAIDGKPLDSAAEEAHCDECQALSFRRKRLQRAAQDAA